MDAISMTCQHKGHYELRFRSLCNARRAFAFPCDEAGRVDIDALSDRVRNNYFYARAVVGRELSMPDVEPSAVE